MSRSALLLSALVGLAACNQPDQTVATTSAAPAAVLPHRAAATAPQTPLAPVLALRASGSSFEVTAATFGQLPAS